MLESSRIRIQINQIIYGTESAIWIVFLLYTKIRKNPRIRNMWINPFFGGFLRENPNSPWKFGGLPVIIKMEFLQQVSFLGCIILKQKYGLWQTWLHRLARFLINLFACIARFLLVILLMILQNYENVESLL